MTDRNRIGDHHTSNFNRNQYPFTTQLFESETSTSGETGTNTTTTTSTSTEDIPILSVDVLPNIPKDAIVDVYYVETSINALGLIGEVVEGYHTGLVFELRDFDKIKKTSSETGQGLSNTIPPIFTIEWYAINFPFGAFLPKIVPPNKSNPTGLEWDNRAQPFYFPGYNPERWSKGRALVGYFNGDSFANYAQWVVDYNVNYPGYQAFEVWDRPNLLPNQTRRWVESTTCSTFAELSLRKMWTLGGKSETPKQILQRSYVPIIAKTKPIAVDVSDAQQAKEVRDFYVELNRAARPDGVDGVDAALTTSEFIRLLADRLEVFYVYDTPNDKYTRIELSPPYFALANLYQPMSLPWQLLDMYGDGKMVDPGAFAPERSEDGKDGEETNSFSTELGRATSSVGGLLRRRLPSIVQEKIGSSSVGGLLRRRLPSIVQEKIGSNKSVLYTLPIAILSALIFVGTFTFKGEGIFNESFLFGLLVGVGLGKITNNTS